MALKSKRTKKNNSAFYKAAARITAIAATIGGACSAFFSSSSIGLYAGITLSASGAGTYMAAGGLPHKRYEKMPHIPPKPGKPVAIKRDMHYLLTTGITPSTQQSARKKDDIASSARRK